MEMPGGEAETAAKVSAGVGVERWQESVPKRFSEGWRGKRQVNRDGTFHAAAHQTSRPTKYDAKWGARCAKRGKLYAFVGAQVERDRRKGIE
jgi:hypothetical protein